MNKISTKKSAKNSVDKITPELHDFVVEYRTYKTELTKKFLNRTPWTPVDESKILSFIPGTISEIFIREGQDVVEGQELLILEAMKMKNILYSNHSGKIKKILVTVGDQVPRSKVVIELELD